MIDGSEKRCLGDDGGRRLPQPGGHGRVQAAIGQWRKRRQLRRLVPLIDLGQRSAAEYTERAAGVVPGATALALGHGPPSGSVQARRLFPVRVYPPLLAIIMEAAPAPCSRATVSKSTGGSGVDGANAEPS